MGDPAGLHHLHEDPAAGGVHALGDTGPAGAVPIGDDAGLAEVAPGLDAGEGALGDDQPGAGALAVVLDVEVAGGAVGVGAHAGERRHHDAVGQGQVTDLQGGEEVGGGDVGAHGWFPRVQAAYDSGALSPRWASISACRVAIRSSMAAMASAPATNR